MNVDPFEIARAQFEKSFAIGELSGAQLLRFFASVDCPVQWIRYLSEDQMIVGLIIKPKSTALVDNLGLLFEIPVIMSRHLDFQSRTIQYRRNIEKNVADQRLMKDVSVVICTDPSLEDKLQQFDKRDHVYIGLTPDRIAELTKGGNPSVAFRQLLQEKLFARDAFDRTGPVEGKEFFGRKDVVADLLEQIARGASVGLYGLRKIGKTSILRNLSEASRRKGRSHCFAIVDLLTATPANRDYTYLLWAIAKSLSAQVNSELRTTVGLRIIGRTPRYEDVSNWKTFEAGLDSDLRALAKHLEGESSRVVILIDEIELLFPITDIRNGFAGYEDFLTYLRGLSQSCGISILVVGVNPNISEAQFLGAGRRNPMYGFFANRYASPMTLSEVREMVHALGRLSGARFEHDAIDRLFEVCGGHPALTRRYCSTLIRGKTRPVTVSRPGVDEIRDQFLRDESSTFAEMVSVVKEYYPEEFNLLAKLALSDNGLDVGDVNRQIRSHLSGYQLVREENGRIILRNELMRDWFSGLNRGPRVVVDKAGEEPQPKQLEQLIRDLELELRRYIGGELVRKFGANAEKRLEIGLGADDVKRAKERRDASLRRFRVDESNSALVLLDYLFMGDLFKLVRGPDWDLFRKAFSDDKKSIDHAMRVIVPVRNALAHNRSVPSRDAIRATLEAEDLLMSLRKADTMLGP